MKIDVPYQLFSCVVTIKSIHLNSLNLIFQMI